jgi:hypothetical protein
MLLALCRLSQALGSIAHTIHAEEGIHEGRRPNSDPMVLATSWLSVPGMFK